jgi:galactokinase
VIGEHTDYNEGLALPFAIEQGVTVRALATDDERIEALALDFGERDGFVLGEPGPAEGWRAFVHGAVAELAAAGEPLVGARLEISGGVPRGAGLSSSAALTVALCLALIELAGAGRGTGALGASAADGGEHDGLLEEPVELARLCSRVENHWTGARTGLLDQLASICGARDAALLIDFRSLEVERVSLELQGWCFAVADSGERHSHASSGYNERREQCAEAAKLLGVPSLRDVRPEELVELPEPLQRRARHVLEENERVLAAIAALRGADLPALAELLSASHASLRDLYEVSTPAVEATVERLLRAGAAGARLVGGGFGGAVLGLFAPGVELPREAIAVAPGPGAHALTG